MHRVWGMCEVLGSGFGIWFPGEYLQLHAQLQSQPLHDLSAAARGAVDSWLGGRRKGKGSAARLGVGNSHSRRERVKMCVCKLEGPRAVLLRTVLARVTVDIRDVERRVTGPVRWAR